MPLEDTSFSKDRRQLLQRGIGVAAALPSAWAAESSGAQTGTPAPRTSAPPAGVLTRTIPRTGESIFNRHAEKRVFPAAQSHGVGVLVNMAMEKGRLHKVVEGHPLPAFAREYGIENWAQYFLKFVMSHPAVTCCLLDGGSRSCRGECGCVERSPARRCDAREDAAASGEPPGVRSDCIDAVVSRQGQALPRLHSTRASLVEVAQRPVVRKRRPPANVEQVGRPLQVLRPCVAVSVSVSASARQ